MILLRTFQIGLVDSNDEVLFKLHHYTQKVNFIIEGLYMSDKPLIEKKWIGEIRSNNFVLIRAKTGLLRIGVSGLLIKGDISEKSQEIFIKIGISLFHVFGYLFTYTFFTIFLVYFLGDMWFILILLLVLIMQLILILIDLNNTQNNLSDLLKAISK